VGFPNATSEAESSNSISAVDQNFWPSCWTVEQKSEFVKKKKLICYFFMMARWVAQCVKMLDI
jgi:hypothetical protein